MNRNTLSLAQDFALLGGAAWFCFGCIATAHRGPRTLAPGQVSVSGSYMRASLANNAAESTPVQLVTVDARAGVGGGADLGIAYTGDISSGNEGLFSTVWSDIKVQTTNRENRVRVPILTLGLLKGYVYHQDVRTHISALPVMLGVPVNDRVTPFLLYRREVISEWFVPESFETRRDVAVVGAEILLGKAADTASPRIGVGLGWMSSLAGGDGEPLFLVNVGYGADTRRRVLQ